MQKSKIIFDQVNNDTRHQLRMNVSWVIAMAFSALASLIGGSATFAQQQQPKNESNINVQRTLRRYDQAAVEGTVVDVFHSAIAGAQVKLINERTKSEIKNWANEDGRFRVVDLEPGSYTIQATSLGFVRLELHGLKLAEEEALNLNVVLNVGEKVGALANPGFEPLPINDTILHVELKRRIEPLPTTHTNPPREIKRKDR